MADMFDMGPSVAIGRGIIASLLLIALFGTAPGSAQQRAETSGDQSPALIAGRDAIVTFGLTTAQVDLGEVGDGGGRCECTPP